MENERERCCCVGNCSLHQADLICLTTGRVQQQDFRTPKAGKQTGFNVCCIYIYIYIIHLERERERYTHTQTHTHTHVYLYVCIHAYIHIHTITLSFITDASKPNAANDNDVYQRVDGWISWRLYLDTHLHAIVCALV